MSTTIAVNLLWCVPGVGGSEEYLIRQLRGLAQHQHNFTILVFAPKGFASRHHELAENYPIIEAPSQCRHRVVRIVLEHTWLAWRTRRSDVVHHGGGTIPKIGRRRTLMTLHDVQWMAYPHYVSTTKLAYLRRVVPSSLRRATRICVPSHFVASTLATYFSLSPNKVTVVRHGIEPEATTAQTPEDQLRKRWSLGAGPIVVYPAITHPHKNHRFILELLTTASSWNQRDLKVVFAGSPGSVDAQVREHIVEHGLANNVVMPGRISPADRNGALAMADAMVFPSEYEGFGAPLIEAMHVGVPIIASDQASIPEVVQDAGIVLPLDITRWMSALDRARTERVDLVARGHQRAQQYTMYLSGQDLLAAYQLAAAGTHT